MDLISDLFGQGVPLGYSADPNACRNVFHLLPILQSDLRLDVEGAEKIYWAERYGALPSRLEKLGRDIAAFKRH